MADRVANLADLGLYRTVCAGDGVLGDPELVILVKANKSIRSLSIHSAQPVLSMLAAIQAPIISCHQNWQAYKDRMSAEHDYEVNLKAELEIMALHERDRRAQRRNAGS
jgi:hypothetical protein